MLKWARGYAKKHNWALNTDEKQLATVIKGLVRNKTKFGKPYCPCRSGAGMKRKTGRSNVRVFIIKKR